MTTQQTVGAAVRRGGVTSTPTSYLNAENVLGSFRFGVEPTADVFSPRFAVAKVSSPAGVEELWLSTQFASKFDGDGVALHGRPPLALALAVDISGSMSMGLEGDDDTTERLNKLEVAKRAVNAITAQLTSEDEVAVLLFNHEVSVLQPMARCTTALKARLSQALDKVRPCGGTRLEQGFAAGMQSLAASAAKGRASLFRLMFLTDMMSSLADEAAVLDAATKNAAAGVHTTVVGVGVDLSVGTVERLSSTRGGRYVSVLNSKEFCTSVGAEFSHDVMPIAFDIKLSLRGGYTIERACGSAELNSLAPGVKEALISSEFASPHDSSGMATGGVLMLRLRPPADEASGQRRSRGASRLAGADKGEAPPIVVETSWKSALGESQSVVTRLAVPSVPAVPQANALRKGLALVRFVDLQASFCEHDSDDLAARLDRLRGYKEGRASLLAEMEAVGDSSLGGGGRAAGAGGAPNASFLQTLDQIIEMEGRETAEAEARQLAAQPRATRSGKRARAGDAATPGTSETGTSSRRGRARLAVSDPDPKEFCCPILHTRMVDPVCTSDGHTFERSAIERWLATSDTSPLTGLRLASKALAPNHALRAMLQGGRA